MTHTNVDRLVDEFGPWKTLLNDTKNFDEGEYEGELAENWLRSALSQARQEGREEGLKLALELVEKNDPNVEMGRMTNPHYWGNCLRRELQAALTTEGK